MNNLIGAIVIAAAVGGALIYNGHQDRLQRQCLAAMTKAERIGSYDASSLGQHALLYSLNTETGVYCAGWGKKWQRAKP